MNDCIFCKIALNESPSYKIYEDDKVIAILDHRPVREGATMVIPKAHHEHFIDLPDELAAYVVKIGNQIGRKMQEALKPKRVGFAVAGFGVAHVHYHVIPMYHEQDITSGVYARCDNNQLVFDIANVLVASSDAQNRVMNLLKLS